MSKCKDKCSNSCGACGINPCKVCLFLLILFRAGIINQNTGSILVFIFLLCCGQGRQQSLCCGR